MAMPPDIVLVLLGALIAVGGLGVGLAIPAGAGRPAGGLL